MTDAPAMPSTDTPEPSPIPETAPTSPDLDAVRTLVLKAHPDVVPELVTGTSVTDLLASIEPARQAYGAIASRVAAVFPPAASVPAGSPVSVPVDPGRLPTAEKLRRGLAERQRT